MNMGLGSIGYKIQAFHSLHSSPPSRELTIKYINISNNRNFRYKYIYVMYVNTYM